MFKGCRPLSEDEQGRLHEFYDAKLGVLNEENISEYNRNYLLHFRDRLYFNMGMMCGFRVSELLSLRVGQVYNCGEGKAYGFVDISKENMKGKKKSRASKLSPTTRRYIEDLVRWWPKIYLRGNPMSKDYLFQGRHPENSQMDVSSVRKRLQKVFKELGFEMDKLATHTLRKTLANNIYNASGKCIITTCRVLGHSRTDTTMSYLVSNSDVIDKFYSA